MKVAANREQLIAAIAVAKRASASRTTIPILTHLLLKTQDERLTLVATDLELGIEAWLPAVTIEKPGAVAVPTKVLEEIVKSLPKGFDVWLELTENNVVKVAAGFSEYEIHGLPADEFPVFEPQNILDSFYISSEELRFGLASTSYALATDISKGTACGLNIEREGETVTFVATDTHRISVYETTVDPLGTEESFSAILTSRVVDELHRTVGNEENVKVEISRTNIRVYTERAIILGRIMEGTYPAWRRVMPRNDGARGYFEIECRTLAEVVSRANIVAKAENGKVVFSIDEKTGDKVSMLVTAQTSEIGKASDKATISSTIEGGIDFAVNAEYVLEAIRALGGGMVKVHVTLPLSPLLVLSEDRPSLRQVVMPMQIL